MNVRYQRQDDWRPRGIEELEPAAWHALRHAGSTCVVAGPGAGKTEFLAQRAAYLLETGLCPAPYRVLAISFKTDAAENLAARVRKRCSPDLCSRFSSVTFDAFTKGLVDRFQNAIPADWRPSARYDIAFPRTVQTKRFLEGELHGAPAQWQADIAALSAQSFESRFIGAQRLPFKRLVPKSGNAYVFQAWWDSQLRASPSALTFTSLNRLSELLLRACPHIRRALRLTYPFVFIDEFQDTTVAQYDFLTSAFDPANTVVTAVGDDKQRIMVWAGARIDAFPRFETDFSAVRIPLQFNFRSSADLVRIQHIVAQALDPNVAAAISRAPSQIDRDVAQVWNSRTISRESAYLANWLVNDMRMRSLRPRDYVLLVKQKADEFESELAADFASAGLRLRNESRALGRASLQDLLCDDFARLAIALFRLGAHRRAPDAWQRAFSALLDIRAISSDHEIGASRVDAELTSFTKTLRDDMAAQPPSEENSAMFLERVTRFLDLESVARTYVAYGAGDLLNVMVEAFGLHLAASSDGTVSWADCLDAFEGVNQIPMMTVHKSKGLEYDTTVFVGLDDGAWWAHKPGDAEGLATFFVALSRAKQRAVFCFCRQRGTRTRVAELYQLLTNAGVEEFDIP